MQSLFMHAPRASRKSSSRLCRVRRRPASSACLGRGDEGFCNWATGRCDFLQVKSHRWSLYSTVRRLMKTTIRTLTGHSWPPAKVVKSQTAVDTVSSPPWVHDQNQIAAQPRTPRTGEGGSGSGGSFLVLNIARPRQARARSVVGGQREIKLGFGFWRVAQIASFTPYFANQICPGTSTWWF